MTARRISGRWNCSAAEAVRAPIATDTSITAAWQVDRPAR
jgi:hypothetical protein